MYTLHNFKYNSPVIDSSIIIDEGTTGWDIVYYNDEHILVCDIVFETETDALAYKLKYPDHFIPATLSKLSK